MDVTPYSDRVNACAIVLSFKPRNMSETAGTLFCIIYNGVVTNNGNNACILPLKQTNIGS